RKSFLVFLPLVVMVVNVFVPQFLCSLNAFYQFLEVFILFIKFFGFGKYFEINYFLMLTKPILKINDFRFFHFESHIYGFHNYSFLSFESTLSRYTFFIRLSENAVSISCFVPVSSRYFKPSPVS